MNQLRHLIIPLLAGLLSSTLLAQAPVTLWTRTIGYHENGYFNSVEQTTDDGFILGGHTSSVDSSCYRLVWLDSNGDIFLDKVFRAVDRYEDQRAIQTADGGFAIAGDGDPWLIRTDNSGNKLWDQATSTLGDYISIYWVEETADQGFIATGTDESSGILKALVVKTDDTGAVVWSNSYGGEYDAVGLSVTETSDGGYAVAGYSAPEAGGINDGWLLKLSATGDSLWSVRYGGTADAKFRMFKETADNGFILVGKITAAGDTTSDIYLVKTDVDGLADWTKTFGGTTDDQGVAVVQTSDLGFTFVVMGAVEPAGDVGGWVVHTDANGDTLWTLLVGDPNYNFGLDLVELGENEYLLAGGRIDWGLMEAYGWVARLGDPFVQDSLALVDIYNAMDGENWINKSGWLTTTPLSDWDGVTIYNGRVTQLSFYNNNLSGSIPPSIVDLTAVYNLSFAGNPGLDSIPAFIGEMTNLYTLDLSYCALTTVPTGLGNLENLENLSLQNNSLTGAFPVWLADLSNLMALRIDNNQFTGPIPTAVTTLANLNTFWINNNLFNFADIEPLVQAELPVTYAPQADVGTPVDTTAILGQPFSIKFTTPGTANTYQWQKNNVNIIGETDSVLSFTATAYTDSGSYDVTINNTIVTELTLSSEDIYIHIALPPIHYDSLALVALYDSTDGANWTDNSGWLNPDSALSSWYGVTLRNGRVDELRLRDNNLSGTIPAEIGALTALQLLYLGSDSLSGSIPTEIGGLISLTDLSIINSQISGSIPTEIGNLVHLSSLTVVGNQQLTGPIPPQIGKLVNLWNIMLEGNQLTGPIPPQIGNLIKLRHLSAWGNALSDTIPWEIGNLTSLTMLDFASNQLSGPIPPEIGNDTSLTWLSLGDNQLTGPIPVGIGNLTKLDNLYLNMNQLSGTIPAELGNLTSCTYLYLHYNQLTGAIPPGIGGLTSVTNLELGHNQLTSIPADIGNLTTLTTLCLDFNRLTDLPDFSPLTSLSLLQVNHNRLTFGDIEPLMGLSIGYIQYGEQDSIGTEIDTTVDIGTRLVMTVSTDGDYNSYQWWQVPDIPRGTGSDTLVIDSVSSSDLGVYVCYINNTLADQLTLISRPVHVSITGLQVVDELAGIPEEYALHANYPNPFNPSTTIRYDLPEATDVILTVYDLLGREVVRLVDGTIEAGYQGVIWNGRTATGREVPTGIYIARLATPGYTRSIKMVLLK